jgi:hypothetical protein
MTSQYRNTFGDLMAFCFYHYMRSPVFIGSFVFGFLFMSLLIFQTLPKDAEIMPRVITFVVLELVNFCLLTGLMGAAIMLSMISRKNRTVLTEHTITLREDGFVEETAYNKTEHKWISVQKLARTRKYIFIYIAQHMAHVVPRRAFRDDAQWDAFFTYCKQRSR